MPTQNASRVGGLGGGGGGRDGGAYLPYVSTIPVSELVSENIWRELNFFHMSIEIP